MSALRFRQTPLSSDSGGSWPKDRLERSAGSTVVELGAAIATAEARLSIHGVCSQCRRQHNPQSSSAQCTNVFCSQLCEQAFVRAALASLSVEDCVHMHRRLETLLMETVVKA